MKTNFILPKTKMCIVIWYRNGEKHEQLMETPPNNEMLVYRMLMNYHVGFSEIRGIKSVESSGLIATKF
jgi:hypothetical protein